jgi:hypothetical protein
MRTGRTNETTRDRRDHPDRASHDRHCRSISDRVGRPTAGGYARCAVHRPPVVDEAEHLDLDQRLRLPELS